MQRLLHRHRRLFSAGILLAFMAAWVLPAQACLADMTAPATHAGCPDCPSSGTAPCCAAMAACAAMLPAAAAPLPSPGKAVPLSALLPGHPVPALVAETITVPAGSPPRYASPSTLSIRFCSFQE